MSYYIRHTISTGSRTLVQMSMRQTEQADISRCGYDRVSPEQARRWVKDGGHHETPLYVEDGKVRYASDPPRRRRRR